MPLRSKLIIYAVVMLLLFAGLSVGSYLSLAAASREAEAARSELAKLSLVEGLEENCALLASSPDHVACARARDALADLERREWREEARRKLQRVLELSCCLERGEPPADPSALRAAVSDLKREIVGQVSDDIRSAEKPAHRRAIRLLVAACLIAVGGAGTFAWLYHRLVRERRRLEERVRQSEKLAALGTLAAGVAHEISNPLATISMSAEALKKRLPAGDEADRFLTAIEEEALRCRRIIEDLSDLARGGSLDREPVEPEELAREALRIVRRDAKLPAAEIDLSIPDGLPLISADRGKLLQVLVNLLLNGVESAGEGGKVRLSARRQDSRLTFEVADDGRGIPAHLLDRIFEPFFTDKDRGVGLGLALCHRIAELHGGELTADSAGPGKGAVFRLGLPLKG